MMKRKVIKTVETFKKKVEEREKNYYQEDGEWYCKKCHAIVMSINSIVSIHDGPFPLSGSGKTAEVGVPYCPECEEEPEPYRLPLRVEWHI